MARKYYNKKKTLKNVGAIALAAIACVGIAAGLGMAANESEDGFDKVHVNYAIGGLDAVGKYEKAEDTLYTKNGFSVEDKATIFADIDFDSTISYQLFFYGENDEFISATEVLTEDYTEAIPDGALTCRVEITPIWGDDVEEENQKVTLLNKYGYANQLKLSVEAAEAVEEE